MNEQDREALDNAGNCRCAVCGSGLAWKHIESRLTHLDDLEKALAWREETGMLLRNQGWYWILSRGTFPDEKHDGTPRGRAEALVRLWRRVTGGE